jgi:hypothetical protein
MLSAVLIAATVAVLAGLGAIALGIPVKEFSFGNTMILSGTIGVCTGLVLFGIAAALAELRVMSHRLRLRLSTDTDSKTMTLSGSEKEEVDIAAAPPLEDLWRESPSQRGRARPPEMPLSPLEPESEPESGPSPKPRRNLLFATASRKERDRAERRGDSLTDFRAPSIDAPPPDESGGPSASPSFESSWPKPEGTRPAETRLPPLRRRAAPAAPDSGPPPLRGETPAVTVIKSGVVDGMAYSLYSDGSIEAQMPEGMMRFESIDELRRHLDQRS